MRKVNKKTLTLVVSLALLLCIGVGGTLAYLFDATLPIENTFVPTKVTTYVVETLDGNEKQNVKIQNTGDIEANIRAAVVFTWQSEDGTKVLAQTPVEETDYQISLGKNWVKKSDGFYYYKDSVAPKDFTDDLIKNCKQIGQAPVDGYYLCVEIIGSGIQAEGIPAGSHPWDI